MPRVGCLRYDVFFHMSDSHVSPVGRLVTNSSEDSKTVLVEDVWLHEGHRIACQSRLFTANRHRKARNGGCNRHRRVE